MRIDLDKLLSGRRAIFLGVGLGLVLGGAIIWLATAFMTPTHPAPPSPGPVTPSPPSASFAPTAPAGPAAEAPPPAPEAVYEEPQDKFARRLAQLDAAIIQAIEAAGLSRQAALFDRVRHVVDQGVAYEQAEMGLDLGRVPLARFTAALDAGLGRLDFGVAVMPDAKDPNRLEVRLDGRLTHLLLLRPAPPERPAPPAGEPAMAAVIIDDLGWQARKDKAFLELPAGVTLSILPFGPDSQALAAAAAGQGREVMVHLPMEPGGYPGVDPGRGALLAGMDDRALAAATDAALASLPQARGANNHMGSRFTEDAAKMKVVLGRLKARGMYFVDSLTTPRSQAAAVAGQLGIGFARRTLFLDNVAEEAAVAAQISRLAARSREHGRAVGIGHPHAATQAALARFLGDGGQGIRIVPASRVVR